jgi:hypothetical protein
VNPNCELGMNTSNGATNVVVFRPQIISGAADRIRLSSVIALNASAPSRVDYHLDELCNLIAREVA